MNDTFNLARFGLLLKKTLVERAVQIGGCFALVAILTGLFYCTIVNVTMSYYEGGNQRVAFSVGLILGSGYISAMLFAHFSNASKGYGYLVLPASFFEKWLCGLTLVAVFIALYCLFFRALDAAYMANFRNHLDRKNGFYKELYANAQIIYLDDGGLKFFYKVVFNLTGVMTLAALYFNKNAVVKGALSYLGLFGGGFYLNQLFAKIFFGGGFIDTRPFLHVRADRSNVMVDMPQNWLQPIDTFFLIVLPLTLWLVALIRLREKEF